MSMFTEQGVKIKSALFLFFRFLFYFWGMEKVIKINKSIIVCAVLTIVSVSLIIGGFFVPPMGEISGSVLTAVGELFAFSALWAGIYAIKRGADVTIKHGATDVTINNDAE